MARTTGLREPGRVWAAGLGLFVLALALRWLFWQATPDSAWPYSACYKGDAATWLAYARALNDDRPFELGIPLRPPANAYLVAWLWNGEPGGVAALRGLWCLLGALTVVLIYGAVRRAFGFGPAVAVGLLCAASSGLMMLSTSLGNETPYLLLVAVSLYLWTPVRDRPRGPLLALWGILHALACLTRVEHALVFAFTSAYLVLAWRTSGRRPWRRSTRCLAVVAGGFALALTPWHLEAWRDVRRFNTEPPATHPATEAAWRQVEASLAGLAWDESAEAERRRLPAFIRRTASNFVAATVWIRGRREVTAADFEILTDAFGSRPEAVASHPFVALYGGLNFYLANNPESDGGFDRSALERPPPLTGGAGRYPRALLAGLPPPDLALTYPPHLEIVNHGFSMGGSWILAHPGNFLRLAVNKLLRFWDGAALGFTGYGLPIGIGGERQRVDLVVPDATPGVVLWRLALLAATAWGGWAAWRRGLGSDLAPWLALLAGKIVAVVAFFGYARQGASTIPVVALLVVLGAGALPIVSRVPARSWRSAALLAGLLLVAIEGQRWASQPRLILDGREVAAQDPWPVDRHEPRSLRVEDR